MLSLVLLLTLTKTGNMSEEAWKSLGCNVISLNFLNMLRHVGEQKITKLFFGCTIPLRWHAELLQRLFNLCSRWSHTTRFHFSCPSVTYFMN